MKVHIIKRETLKPSERDEMYAVFSRYYANVDHSRFRKDLESKDWIILLSHQDSGIVGFSTQQIYRHSGPSGSVVVVYSGDTIIDRAYRHHTGLAGAFGHFLRWAIRECSGLPVYWLLTSKGARTYRFLPVFFNTFFPAFDRAIPVKFKVLIDALAVEKFGACYLAQTQVVCHGGQRDWLCEAEHDPALLGRDDPHIRFFLERNPGYAQGDELVCLAEVSENNLNGRARRVISRTEVVWRE